MKSKIRKIVFVVSGAIGVLLLLLSFLALILYPAWESHNEKKAIEVAENLKIIMPDIKEGTTDSDRSNLTMASLEYENENYVCIIEIPAYNVTLPVRSVWNDNLYKSPSRYSGSVYNSTLVIGGSGNKGQFDFMKTITETDKIYITDMTGSRFSYSVSKINVVNEIQTSDIENTDFDLVVFSKDTINGKYTILYCNL